LSSGPRPTRRRRAFAKPICSSARISGFGPSRIDVYRQVRDRSTTASPRRGLYPVPSSASSSTTTRRYSNHPGRVEAMEAQVLRARCVMPDRTAPLLHAACRLRHAVGPLVSLPQREQTIAGGVAPADRCFASVTDHVERFGARSILREVLYCGGEPAGRTGQRTQFKIASLASRGALQSPNTGELLTFPNCNGSTAISLSWARC
jgi:hypothetical protein